MKIENCKLKIITSTFVALLFLCAPLFIHSAALYFTVPKDIVFVGEDFEVALMLDTEGEAVNAIEGKIRLPKDTFFLRDIRTGDSIVDLWVEGPQEEGGVIVFSGIIPGGFQGVREPFTLKPAPGTVLSLLVRAHAPGTAVFSLEEVALLAHDGLGTPLSPDLGEGRVAVESGAEDREEAGNAGQEKKDTTPPEQFEITLVEDPALFEGKKTAIFTTQDKGSGVDYYEVYESSKGYSEEAILVAGDIPWRRARSPHVLANQEEPHFIYVKAVDKSGNVRVARGGVGEEEPSGVDKSKIGLTVFGIIIALLLIFFFKRAGYLKRR